MIKRGIPPTKPSKDKARRTVKAELETLLRTRLDWKEPSGKRTKDYLSVHLCSSAGIKNGNILLGFSPELARYLVGAYVMQYPVELLKIDERNPNAYFIGKKLAQHFSVDNNTRKGTANIISVKTLLEWCEDTIPTYEQVARGNRHTDVLIIQPLETALDVLQSAGIITWEYCNSKKTPLTNRQLSSSTYSSWHARFIHFEFPNAPDQTARLEARTEEIAKAQAPKKKPRRKKTDKPIEGNET